MKHREPFNLNTILIVYNFIQVVVSVFLFVEVSYDQNWEAWINLRVSGNDWSMVDQVQLEVRTCRLFLRPTRFKSKSPSI